MPAVPKTFDAASAMGAVDFISSSAGTRYIVIVLTSKYKIMMVATEAIITLGIVFSGSDILSAGTVAVSRPIKLHMTSIVTVDNKENRFKSEGLTSGLI